MVSFHISPQHRPHSWWLGASIASFAAALAGLFWLSKTPETATVPYESARDLERRWGRLITVANVTMHGRRPGADRIGFFQAGDGTIWGLPMAAPGNEQAVFGCAPADLAGAPVTDSLPANLGEIVGASDFHSDLRTGQSGLHLLIRDARRGLRWQRVAGSEHVSPLGITCREEPRLHNRNRDPLARYHYFRIARIDGA